MEEYPLVRRDIFSGIPGREGERKGGSLPQREGGREGEREQSLIIDRSR
jgi:hypothetical protein